VEAANGAVPNSYAFFPGKLTKLTPRAIISIAAAIVTVRPGGMRELHWHPNADEWQYYVKGTARMTVYAAAGNARTMDFLPGDVGYIEQSKPHDVENIGDDDLVFLEIFPTAEYQDVSLGEWLAHTSSRLVNEHLGTGEEFLAKISKSEVVITPESK
jgi:oxalate decarboxylase